MASSRRRAKRYAARLPRPDSRPATLRMLMVLGGPSGDVITLTDDHDYLP